MPCSDSVLPGQSHSDHPGDFVHVEGSLRNIQSVPSRKLEQGSLRAGAVDVVIFLSQVSQGIFQIDHQRSR
jgi:hypothetical protein